MISQNPAPGDRVAKETIVTLTVSSGAPKTTVPALANLPAAQAQTLLENAGLKMTVHYVPSSTVPEGSVTASNPGKGTTVLVGSTVDVNVSTGPKQVGVPNVVGQPYENAAGQLKGAGFKVVPRGRGERRASRTPSSRRAPEPARRWRRARP